MNLTIYFDGLCEPRNPGGYACYGFQISQGANIIAEHFGCVREGKGATNNFAEYCALGFSLKYIIENRENLQFSKIDIFGDSKLVINQINGEWKCNKSHLRQLRDRCKALINQIGVPIELKWVSRDENERADRLSQMAYEKRTGKKVIPRRKR